MYPQVNSPKKVTERWLNQAFAPLSDYLNREHPEEARKIMAYMTFMCNEDQRFYYKNCISNDSIVLNQLGELVFCGREALRYKFEYPESTWVDRPSKEERFVHPNVTKWMEKSLNKKAEEKYGEEVSIFLQELWGPIVNFDFSDLKVGYPIKRAKTRYCLYLYPSEFLTKTAIQFVGDEIVERRCSYSQYSEYEKQVRNLNYEGWQVITVIREFLDRNLDQFRLYISKAVEMAEPRDQMYMLTELGRREQ
ncbi:hypothetical protein HZF08_31985 [Paenibacillus sp. CGMCC 1.16610]|uniref:Uncharacterized protein n=1 Tax=Paenibacillus anseongense TaxID=2682845 RepID=A0ABW9UIV2_9BACL|nr:MULTISPECIES: hypothetical protein [Paenibacillus]MBA2942896.1 hypothetical protein [Paenibacillus sp. CGMCC 1.16610]MVQ38380.1 hypothetical protein [Paenibacillus anseongense]